MSGTPSVFTFSDGSDDISVTTAEITSASYDNKKSELVSVVIGTSCTSIASRAFQYSNQLINVIIDGNTLETINQYAFSNSTLAYINIPDSVTEIGGRAFENCINLTSISIGNSVTTIWDRAFEGCFNLTSISIGNSVTTIGSYTFSNCSNLETIEFRGSTSDMTIIGNYIFNNINRNSNRNITFYNTATESDINRTLLSQVEGITNNENVYLYGDTTSGAQIFYTPYPYETTFTFNDGTTVSVTSATIGSNSYGDDNKSVLTSVVIGISCTTIGNETFKDCINLRSVTITDSVTTIDIGAFQGCTSLTSITIPSSVTTINDYAFFSCNSLETIDFRGNTSTMTVNGDNIFNNINRNSNRTITFYNTATERDINGTLLSQTKTITNNENVYLYGDTTSGAQIFYTPYPYETIFTFNDGRTVSVTSATIGSNSYGDDNKSVLTSVVIGISCTTIGNETFKDCINLTSVTITDSVTSIGIRAFTSCTSLTSITIPDSVTSIGDYAFFDCTSLTKITVDTSNPNYSNNIDNNNNSDGVLYNKNINTLIQYPIGNSADSFSISSDVTTISDFAFYKSQNLVSVTIPTSVTSIGYRAFSECLKLGSINVNSGNPNYSNNDSDGVLYNNGVTTLIQYPIGNPATDFTIPDNVNTISDFAFYKSQNLRSVTIPSSVTTINSYAFQLSERLTSITIPVNVTTIGNWVFAEITSLTSAVIGNGVSNIGFSTFSSCTNLTLVTIGQNVPTISNSMFRNCSSLPSVTIPNSVTTIDIGAFQGCTSLTSITIPSSVTTINDYAFFSCNSLETIGFRGNTSTMTVSGDNIFSSITSNSTRTITFYNTATERDIQSDLLGLLKLITDDDTVSTTGPQIFITTKSGPVPVILSVINLGSF